MTQSYRYQHPQVTGENGYQYEYGSYNGHRSKQNTGRNLIKKAENES